MSIKLKTMEHIPLLKDMAIMTDPVPQDFFADPHAGNTLKRLFKQRGRHFIL